MNRSFAKSAWSVAIAAIPLLTCSCSLILDVVHQSQLHSEWEREKNSYRLLNGNRIEYTKLGFGIANSPTQLVKTERKWTLGFRERWWEPSAFYESWEDEHEGRYPLLVFAHGKIPEWAVEKDYCGHALADLNTYFKQFKMYVGDRYVIGGREWQIKMAEDRGSYDLPREGKLWHLCRCKLTLVNGQEYDFTFCYLKRDNWLYAFKLFTPEPRRNDDFELMLAWMDSLYFLDEKKAQARPQ